MISNFKLKFGRVPNEPSEQIPTTPITVFVGPNNSGKSQVLSEFDYVCRHGQQSQNDVIIESVAFSGLLEQAAVSAIEHLRITPGRGENIPEGRIIVGSMQGRTQVRYEELLKIVQKPEVNIRSFCSQFLNHYTLSLNGSNRIQLVNDQGLGDLQKEPQTSFQVLFRDDKKRTEVRRIIHDAFGLYFVLDPTVGGQLRVRLSDSAPKNVYDERGLHNEAIEFHAKAQLISYASDGVKAFTGIITEIIAGDPMILLIDEPEAFLHPSLATKLGYEVSRAAKIADKRVFVSTHSPAFVMGCIQSGSPVTIVRLTYRSGVATARVLPSDEILELMRNPLLRSTGVLSGLFYEFVVVTESDADRAFYQEVNERLLRFKPEWGIPNCLFINAQNKQTVHTLLKPLRKLGIPAVGVVDIDVLKEGGTVWANLMSGANIPEINAKLLADMRAALKKVMDETGKDMKKHGGIDILGSSDREAASNLLQQLSEYGVFVVPGGELESWLKMLNVSGHGSSWLIGVFEKMGENQDSCDYIKPIEDDVWKFMSTIRGWLMNPNRKGIPR